MQGRITANKLNIRNRPAMDARILGVATRSTLVDIEAETRGWYAIRYAGYTAFVHCDFVDIVHQPVAMKGRVSASKLNVRSAPSLSGDIIATVQRDTVLQIISELEDWLRIDFDGVVAYVSRDHVERMESNKGESGVVTAEILNVTPLYGFYIRL